MWGRFRISIFKITKKDTGKYGLFPEKVIERADELSRHVSLYYDTNVEKYSCSFYINGEMIEIPYRVYYDINRIKINKVSESEKIMIHCIGTRNHNGFLRQEHLELLLTYEFLYWTVPYIIKICDEYVIQILEIVYSDLSKRDTKIFKEFTAENPEMIKKSYSRMVSYWNAYYRRKYPNLKGYVGYKIFKEHFDYCIEHKL